MRVVRRLRIKAKIRWIMFCEALSLHERLRGKQNAHAWFSANQRRSMVVEILCSAQNDLIDILAGQSVLYDSPLDDSYVIPSREELLLSWIDAPPDGHSLAVPEFNKFHPTSSSRSKKVFKAPRKLCTLRRKNTTMGTRFNTAKASSDEMPGIDSESDREYLC